MEVKATQKRSSGSQGAATEKHPSYVTQSPMLAPCKHSISGAAHKNAIFLHAGIPMFFVRQFLTTQWLSTSWAGCKAAMSQHADCLHRLTLGRRAVSGTPLWTPQNPPHPSRHVNTTPLSNFLSLSRRRRSHRAMRRLIVHAENREDPDPAPHPLHSISPKPPCTLEQSTCQRNPG